jgi:hypothetical protein
MSNERRPLIMRVGPLGIVAVVWVAVAALFPTTEPQPVSAGTGPAGGLGSPSAALGSGPGASDPGGDAGDAAGVTVGAGGGGGGGTVAAGGGGGGDGGGGDAASAAVAAEGASGTTRGGHQCEPGVRQIPVSSYAVPCMPAWSGDNGGATARGVTAEEILIVERVFPETANSRAVAAVGEQAGAASKAQNDAIFETYKAYLNETYELYGRQVRWVRWESQFGNATDEVQSKGREGACLDADVIASELKAFAVVGERAGAVSGPFAECAAQRGLVVLNGAAYFPERFYRDLHPYVWAFTMECERISYQVAEYIGKRLAGKPARWAGDPLLAAKTRTFATYVPNNDEYQHCVNITERVGKEQYGTESTSRYNYTLDVSRFPDEAARGAVQFKADGATTVILACDPISAIFLTQSATSQAYHPEWFLIGTAAQDTDLYGQLYDQRQADGHMFGMSQLGATRKVVGPDSEAGRLYEHITGQRMVDGASGGYSGAILVYNFLQAAGPNLTAEAIAAGARAMPPGGAPDFPLGYWSFADGPDGTPGAGDHTAVDDSREIYWTQSKVSPDTGNPGTFVETYGGQRFRNGEWPAEDPPIYPGA